MTFTVTQGTDMRKTQPAGVHVPGPLGDIEKQTYQPPESAKNNAQRVLDWKEKHGDEVKGMTSVGWARARQLASGKPISRDTVARMSAFNRHRKNAEVSPEFKSEPWKDRGYVAFLGWGGVTGVDWARSIMSGLKKSVDVLPLSLQTRPASQETENIAKVTATRYANFGPSCVVFTLKTDVPLKPEFAKAFGVESFCTCTGRDAENLFVVPLTEVSIPVEPASEIVRKQVGGEARTLEHVAFPLDDSPTLEITCKILSGETHADAGKFSFPVGRMFDGGHVDDARKAMEMFDVCAGHSAAKRVSATADAAIGEQKTGPVRGLVSITLEKIALPLNSINGNDVLHPSAMRAERTCIFHKRGHSGHTTPIHSGNSGSALPILIEVEDITLFGITESGHVSWLEKEHFFVKRQINDDIFTLPQEAMARSYDLGFGGEIHMHETAYGQRTYMPGENHDAYLGRYDEPEYEDEDDDEEDDEDDNESPDDVSRENGLLERAITAIMATIMEHDVKKHATILKTDEESRMVYGWASVSTVKGELVVDQQGDTLAPAEMVKMADGFMSSVRTAKAMHEGAGIGEVIHSMPLTNDIMKAFGIECDREGWLVAMKIHDDNIWALVKSGELSELSIGGRAGVREAIA